MPINEAPEWITEFLKKKAPWWLDEGGDVLEVVFVEPQRRIARVKKGQFTYTLIPELFRIV